MLESIYRAHGYKVGLFTLLAFSRAGSRSGEQPNNVFFRNRTLVGENSSLDDRQMECETSFQHPTFFEAATAAAFLAFDQKGVDLAITETGLGGRLDSTNVINPMVSVITTIGFDHCEMLGNTLSQIAREKAGIIKPQKPVVAGWLDDEARDQVMDRFSKRKKTPSIASEIKNPSLCRPLIFRANSNAAMLLLLKRAAELCQYIFRWIMIDQVFLT